MNPQTRIWMIVGIIIVLGAVLLFQYAWPRNDSASSASVGLSPHTLYLQHAELLDQIKQALQAHDQRIEYRTRLQQRWDQMRQRMVQAPTPELASARLRNHVQRLMAQENLEINASSPVSPTIPIEDEAIRVIGLSLSFSTQDIASVYRVIDRLEHFSDIRLIVQQASVNGPARRPYGAVDVEVQILALCHLTGNE